MTTVLVVALLVVAAALILRWRRPAWYWLAFGVALAVLRVSVRYASVMDACGLTVPPSRFRLTLARMAGRPAPESRAPRVLRIRPTRTGLVLRVKLRPGQDAFDFAASCDRLRHSFGMYAVTAREVKSGVVELRMTGYDVLKRVQMPAKTEAGPLRVAVALRDDGAVLYRDYRTVPHALNIGATQSGKSVYQRRLVAELARQPVALAGIDCKQGMELGPLARRFSALAEDPDSAAELLDALAERMAGIYRLIRREQQISVDIPDADIAADIFDLPEHLRPVPIVLLIDEVAELALFTTKEEEKRRDRIITALVRLAQLGRAAGIYVEVCGQRFGSELGKGITMLRAQLTGRTAHRVNDETSANMAFGDIAPDAVLAAIQIPREMPGVAVVADSIGWARTRTPFTTLRQAVNVCNRHAHLTPDVPELAPFRPVLTPAVPPKPLHAPDAVAVESATA
ncbi:FtsK/SpoIIIE domain-containing protein [Streptomyces sp. HNM0663]|uniref:FtsK/SpoIIIE domain-containing protein n=1 Tax=Streptomyces chengmaiensis TaxID=3040919 RepID=A0ABT6HN59_9ACTN|nr:FtsK/SpoIIIE domain-containing protein [Streptomyces chengmaiensis]MDH2389732.1 FtsK/SpoIIIE domain-containing protein [Streptomyces chengmaiensis]